MFFHLDKTRHGTACQLNSSNKTDVMVPPPACMEICMPCVIS